MSRERKTERKLASVRESRVGTIAPIALNDEEAERYLGLGRGYLKEWRRNGSRPGGRPAPPPHIKMDPSDNGKVIYLIEDLNETAKLLPKIQVP